jgi:hypothetical protein
VNGEPEFHGLFAAPAPLPLLPTAIAMSCQPVVVGVTEPTCGVWLPPLSSEQTTVPSTVIDAA